MAENGSNYILMVYHEMDHDGPKWLKMADIMQMVEMVVKWCLKQFKSDQNGSKINTVFEALKKKWKNMKSS